MYLWHDSLKLKKRRSFFRYHFEHLRMLQERGACRPDAMKRFVEFLKRGRKALTRIQKQGADVGYVLWVIFKVAWITRIPPIGSRRDFWKAKQRVLESALEAMKELRPYFFSDETIREMEQGLNALKTVPQKQVIYAGVMENRSTLQSNKGRRPKDRIDEAMVLLSQHFKEAVRGPRPRTIAELMNACALGGFPLAYFDEAKIEQRLRRFRLPDPRALYAYDKSIYQTQSLAMNSFFDPHRGARLRKCRS